MGQWHNWQLHLYYHHVCWVVLHLKLVTMIKDSVLPQKNISRYRAAVNCTFIWKENFSMWPGYQKSFQQQSTCFVTYSHVIIAEFNYKHYPKWPHHQVPLEVKHAQMSRWSFPHGLVWWSFNGNGNHSTGHHWDNGRLFRGESFIFLYINTLFPTLKELLSTDMASQITAEMVS